MKFTIDEAISYVSGMFKKKHKQPEKIENSCESKPEEQTNTLHKKPLTIITRKINKDYCRNSLRKFRMDPGIEEQIEQTEISIQISDKIIKSKKTLNEIVKQIRITKQYLRKYHDLKESNILKTNQNTIETYLKQIEENNHKGFAILINHHIYNPVLGEDDQAKNHITYTIEQIINSVKKQVMSDLKMPLKKMKYLHAVITETNKKIDSAYRYFKNSADIFPVLAQEIDTKTKFIHDNEYKH